MNKNVDTHVYFFSHFQIMTTKRRLQRYIPALSELEYDLQCEWGNDCRVRIQDLKEFYRHLDEHLSNFINQYQQVPSTQKLFSSKFLIKSLIFIS